MFAPILAAIILSTETLLDKKILTGYNVSYRDFVGIGMFFVWIFILPMSLFLGQIKPEALSMTYIGYLIIVSILAVLYNLIYFRSLQHEHVVDILPFVLITPLVTIVFASIFAGEHNSKILILGFLASTILILTHIERKHLIFNRYLAALIIYSILFATEAIFIKKLLVVYSPIALYAARVSITAFLMGIAVKPRFERISPKPLTMLLLVAFLASIRYPLIYFSFKAVGIIFTVLILTLEPVLTYILSVLFLKEELKWKNAFGVLVILAIVIYAQLFST